MFAMTMLAQPVAAANISMGDDEWIGLGMGTGGRIVFDSTPAPDQIEIMEADVGINDDDPDFKLEVAGSSGSGYFGVSSAAGNDGDVFIIDSSGNVGIGLTNPGNKLTVQQDISTSSLGDGQIRIQGDSDQYQFLSFKLATAANYGQIQAGDNSPGAPLYYPLALNPSGGNVGIGTASPTGKLDVNGNDIRIRTSQTPASCNADGYTGEIAWDSDYIYVCTSGDGPSGSTDTWGRVALQTSGW
jgi:hypothetical protein